MPSFIISTDGLNLAWQRNGAKYNVAERHKPPERGHRWFWLLGRKDMLAVIGLDIDGFIQSTAFIAQIAAVVSAIISSLVAGLFLPIFGQA